jgi:hypothetical protein
MEKKVIMLPLLCYSATIMYTLNLGSIPESQVLDLQARSLQALRLCIEPGSTIPVAVIGRALAWIIMCSMVRADHQSTRTHLDGLRLVLTHFDTALFSLPSQVQQMITFCDITSRIRCLGQPLFMTDHLQRPRYRIPQTDETILSHNREAARQHLLLHGLVGQRVMHCLDYVLFFLEDSFGRRHGEVADVQSMYYNVYSCLLDLLEIGIEVQQTCLHQFRKSFVTVAWSLALVGPAKVEFARLFQSLLDELGALCRESCESLTHQYHNPQSLDRQVCPVFSRFTSNQEPASFNALETSCTATCIRMHGCNLTTRSPMFAYKCRIYGPIFVFNPITPIF